MATLSPSLRQRFFSASGAPLAGGKVYTYRAGTTTPLASYGNSSETITNTNPVILDANGECDLWLGATAYKIKLTDSADVEQWTVDNINQSADATSSNPDLLENFGITCSANSNVLTINLTNSAGGIPSALDPTVVGFRSSTLSSGLVSNVSITSSLGMTLSNGSTLGHSSGVSDQIFVYLLNNNGVAELAVSSTLYPETALYSTTAEGGAGAADSRSVIYSVNARTNVPIRIVGRLTVNQPTAGQWTSVPTQIQVGAISQIYAQALVNPQKPTVQRFTSIGSGTYTTPANCRYIVVEVLGGGGGGGGGANGTAASPGSTSTFGTSLLTGGGGTGGVISSVITTGGAGGTAIVNSPAIPLVVAPGGMGGVGQSGAGNAVGGHGGSNPLCSGPSGGVGGAGASAAANTGCGGGGGSTSTVANAGHGGGGGGYVKALIQNPDATYSFAVGGGGGGQTAGAGGYAAGNGAAGVIIVTEYYI